MSDSLSFNTTNIDLNQYGILRPEKVRWIFPKSTDVLSQLKSKGLRSFLADVDQILERNGVSYEHKMLTNSDFQDWLPYYREKMLEQNHQVIANPVWFKKCTDENKEVSGYFFYQHGRMVGSAIQVETDSIVTLAFKASDRIQLSSKGNSNLGSAIEYIYLQNTHKTPKVVSSGTSRNAFGVINSLGYLDFKLRFGYVPQKNTLFPDLETVSLSNNGVVVFFSPHPQEDGKFFLMHRKSAVISAAKEALSKSSLKIITIEIPLL